MANFGDQYQVNWGSYEYRTANEYSEPFALYPGYLYKKIKNSYDNKNFFKKTLKSKQILMHDFAPNLMTHLQNNLSTDLFNYIAKLLMEKYHLKLL